MQLQNHQT